MTIEQPASGEVAAWRRALRIVAYVLAAIAAFVVAYLLYVYLVFSRLD